MQREVDKLNRSLGGIREMGGLPDALFIIDVGYQKGAVVEAKKLGIPVIGVVDTNNSPEGVDYIIPGNDDSARAIRLYARGMADAALEGRAQVISEIVGGEEFVEVEEEVDVGRRINAARCNIAGIIFRRAYFEEGRWPLFLYSILN